jgi:ectoine hydroxylase
VLAFKRYRFDLGYQNQEFNSMRLADEQLLAYRKSGCLFLPKVFSANEIAQLKLRLPALFAADTPQRVLEKDGVTVRSLFASHENDPAFRRLARDSRLVEPAEQIVADGVYIHQFKINAKLKFSGDTWIWHQDYIVWREEDGIALPNLTTAVIFLDDVTDFNGPLFFIPSSHEFGAADVQRTTPTPAEYATAPPWINNLIADIKYPLQLERVSRLARQYGITAPKGAAGAVIFFHPNIFHASPPNLSPFDRALVLVTYNAINNTPAGVDRPRPDFLCSRDYVSIECERLPLVQTIS